MTTVCSFFLILRSSCPYRVASQCSTSFVLTGKTFCLTIPVAVAVDTFENTLIIIIIIMTILGWGTLYSGGGHPDVLQEVIVPHVPQDECENLYWPNDEIEDNMICAGEAGKDSCQVFGAWCNLTLPALASLVTTMLEG